MSISHRPLQSMHEYSVVDESMKKTSALVNSTVQKSGRHGWVWIYRVHSCISAIDAKVIVVSVHVQFTWILIALMILDTRLPPAYFWWVEEACMGTRLLSLNRKGGYCLCKCWKTSIWKQGFIIMLKQIIMWVVLIPTYSTNLLSVIGIITHLLSLITIPECKQQVLEICHQFYNEDCLQVTITSAWSVNIGSLNLCA